VRKKKPDVKDAGTPRSERLLIDETEDQIAHSSDLKKQTPETKIHNLQNKFDALAEEFRRIQLVLEESRDKYLELYDFAPLGYITVNDKALITEVNLAGAMLLGADRNDIINHGLNQFLSPEDLKRWDRYFANMKRHVKKPVCILTFTRGDSSLFHARLEGVRTICSEGAFTVHIAISDITDMRNAEEALRKSEEKYREIFENSVVGLFQTAPGGRMINVNNAFAHMYGFFDAAEMLAGDFDVGSPPYANVEDRLEVLHILAEKGRIENYEAPHLKRDGTRFWVSITARTILNNEGKVLLYEGTIIDITDRKRTEEALALASKKLALLSSINRNDINNQLTALLGYISILEKKQPDTTHNDYFQKISTAAQRISSIIQFTREFESVGVNAPAWQDCRTLIDTAATQTPLGQVMLKNDLPSGTEVFADPLIVKVFYNLLDNGMQYGKKITTIHFAFEEQNGDHVLVYKDDGDGIVAEEKEKIFMHGFGKNTGFGLALSQEILSITGITIRENGEPGKGARFEMVVPKAAWRITGIDKSELNSR